MVRSLLASSACVAFTAIAACGLDVTGTANGSALDDAGGGHVDASVIVDASGHHDGPSFVGDGATTNDGPSGCSPTGTVSCFALPSGWSVIDFAPSSQTSACPAPFAAGQTDVEEGPTPGPACRCDACSVTAQPSCQNGAVTSAYDDDGLRFCFLGGATLANNPGGGCIAEQHTLAVDVKLTPPAPTGGICTSTLSKHKEVFTFASLGRACAAADPASAGCTNGVCMPPAPPAPYKTCISMPGVQSACPAGPFTVKHVVGTDVTFDCGSTMCGCNVTGDCKDGTVTFFTDSGCQSNPLVLVTDDMCHAVAGGGGNTMYKSYRYDATPMNVACATAAPAAPSNVQLVGATTICCAP